MLKKRKASFIKSNLEANSSWRCNVMLCVHCQLPKVLLMLAIGRKTTESYYFNRL